MLLEGPIIRVTPDEIHVNDVGFLDTVYAPSMSRRDKYEYQLRTLRVPGGVGTIASYEVHKKRREALNPFFSRRNVLHLELLITEKVGQLCEIIKGHAVAKRPVNLSDLFFAFSNDIVTNLLFAHQTDVLSDEAEAAKLRENNMLALLDRVREVLLSIMKAKASGVTNEKPLGPTGKEAVYSSIPDDPILPASEKSLLRLEQEGALLVLAGGESPIQTLNFIFCRLLSYPGIIERLHTELSTVPNDAPLAKLEQLPCLSAVIEERNRLSFESLLDLQELPTKLSPILHHTESVFPGPFKFHPKRWLGDEGRELRRFQMASGKGGCKCLGIELARAELYLVVAALVRRFDMIIWQTDESEVAFVHDFQVAMPKMGPKGVRVMAVVI